MVTKSGRAFRALVLMIREDAPEHQRSALSLEKVMALSPQPSRIASTSGGSKDESERFQLLKEAVALSVFTQIGANFGRARRPSIYFGSRLSSLFEGAGAG